MLKGLSDAVAHLKVNIYKKKNNKVNYTKNDKVNLYKKCC